MTVTCPNCGKPVRQGAKYCGSCRAELPASLSVTPVARPNPNASASPPPGGMLCPKCGTIVRQGAKFCPRCGNAFQAPAAAAPQTQTTVLPAPTQQAAQVYGATAASRTAGGTEPHPVQPARAAAAPTAPAQSRKRRSQTMIIAAALLLVCCAATAMAALSREQWQPRLNAVLGGASVEKAATPTEEPAPLPTNTPAATATIEPTATFTTTPIPTETQPAPTATQPLRQKPSDTPVPTPETTEALEVMLINEDFSQGSLEKWKLSSEDTPVIQTEGATTALVFPSVGSTALFAKAFELKPGSMIEIVMQVEPEEEQGLHVRWIPGAAEPTDFEKGSRIKIDAGNGNMHFGLLRAEGSDELTADIDLVNANMQTFKILVRNDLSIAFLLNDEEVFGPGDRILSPGESSTGFIVFYGKGKLGLFQVSDKAKTGIKR